MPIFRYQFYSDIFRPDFVFPFTIHSLLWGIDPAFFQFELLTLNDASRNDMILDTVA